VIRYRDPIRSDLSPFRLLCEQTFPIRYGEKFYDSLLDKSLATSKEAVPGSGIVTIVATSSRSEASERFKVQKVYNYDDNDDIPPPVYTGKLDLCDFETESDEVVVGGLSCRLFVGSLCEDKNVSKCQDEKGATLLYIMTLVTLPMFQRCGIASELVSRCVAYGKSNPGCVAVYLHVITYNRAAVRFYESRGFKYVSRIKDFYKIKGKKYDCFLYKYEIRKQPLNIAVANAARASAMRRRRRGSSGSEDENNSSRCVIN